LNSQAYILFCHSTQGENKPNVTDMHKPHLIIFSISNYTMTIIFDNVHVLLLLFLTDNTNPTNILPNQNSNNKNAFATIPATWFNHDTTNILE